MRLLQRLRDAYAEIEGHATPVYGFAASLAVALPLIVGALTDHDAQGATISLGAYLVALRTPESHYGVLARNLAATVAVITVCATIGGFLSGHTWLAVVVVPPIVALGSAVRWIGPTAALTVLMTAVRPHSEHIVYNGLLELVGGLLMSALLLAPWPARRLRPLRTALADAAEGVAGALDAVVEEIGEQDPAPLERIEAEDPGLAAVARPPGWQQSRRTASRALARARGTVGLYRAVRTGEPTRPDRLLKHLGRIMHETIALESLIGAAERHPPDRPWELEARVAVTALAARLRLIAATVANPADLPLGDQESPAVRRFARQSEKIRRAGMAGDEDIVAVSLVDQIGRSIERIAGSVDAARRVAEGGVHIGVGPPRPFAPHPLSAWEQLSHAVRTRSPDFRQTSRQAVAVAVAMAIAAALRLRHAPWLTITTMQSLRGTYEETVTHLMQRVGGTVAGSVVAAVLLALTPDQLSAALVLFAFAMAAFSLRGVNFTYWALFGTPLAMMLLEFSTPSTWTSAGERVVLTLAGCALAFLAVRLLWPHGYTQRLPLLLDRLLCTHAELARTTSALVDGGEIEQLPQSQLTAAEQATEKVNETRARLSEERVPRQEQINELDTAVRAANRIRDHLIAMGRIVREDHVDIGPVPEILERVADRLDEAADALDDPPEERADREDKDDAAADERLDGEFTDLDEHLSNLARRRNSEVEAGAGPDESTPLQHALLQVSGTRYAARALRRDTDKLIKSARAALTVTSPSASTRK